MTAKVQIKATITGKVQGVFFRYNTKNTADSLGLKGYVKNLPNGCVEAVFQGEHAIVDQALEWCQKGPAQSRVDDVRTAPMTDMSNFQSFNIDD